MSAAQSEEADGPAALTVGPRAGAGLAAAGERLATLLDDAVAGGYPAGATLAVLDADGELMSITSGWACLVGTRIATSSITRYDLASLTKVVSTVPLVMALAQRGAWSLDDPLSRWLEEVSVVPPPCPESRSGSRK